MRERLEHESIDYREKLCNSSIVPEHIARCRVTSGLLGWMKPESVVDPACGDGSIVRWAADQTPLGEGRVLLGDVSRSNIEAVRLWAEPKHGYRWRAIVGTAEQTLDWVAGGALLQPDVIVLTEILEHLEDPDSVLRLARAKGKRLIASSPEMRPDQVDTNPEHLWMFDGAGYEQMLIDAGWRADIKTHLTFRSMYDFGIWVCS